MGRHRVCILSLLLLLTHVLRSGGVHDSLNVLLVPGGEECFFEQLQGAAGNPRQIEIFVPKNGNTDLLLSVYGPLTLSQVQKEDFSDSVVLTEAVDASDQVEADSLSFIQEFSADRPGIYAFCVDNSRARFMTKRVEFNLKVLSSDDDELQTIKAGKLPLHDDEEVDERLKESLSDIRDGLQSIQDQQRIDRNRQSLHSATNRSSHNGVVIDSILETVVFILSLLFQVIH